MNTKKTKRIPVVALFLAGMTCLTAGVSAHACDILPDEAQRFLYYMKATSQDRQYSNVWERVADSLILSTGNSAAVRSTSTGASLGAS